MSSAAAASRVAVAVELEGPAGELQAERDRLGVDRVGAAHHHRPGLGRARATGRPGSRSRVERAAARRRAHWSASAGIDDVAAGQAEVQVATLRPPISATWLTKAMTSWSVVRSSSAIRVDVDARPLLDGCEGVGRDQAARAPGRSDGELDAQHQLEARLVGPDAPISGSV